MDKIQRATEIHRSMTPHQMALRIVELDDACAIAAKRITELQDALELAEEAVRANHPPVAQDGWQLVPVEPTFEMVQAATHSSVGFGTRAAYQAMLAAAPKLGGE